ncbi:hypothetical protein CNBE4470 [Cryptococcus deneoformans B-3501A]|uniref:hypothetical protein n=1 Tax=Cryptococcus deneoformans (strain B-3501A) TaxID=283643 RepID=UPI000042F74E|nr:hypothetical protein CNBE4470 [Cryptococcus neoformans var. neoformans B-3501A]EAL20527.1 hypothetical protein CNBE4470 [Cryptococcus neoformans var. neoformans B-3501A]
MPTQTRPVSLHERFSLTRRNAGYPPILAIAASYPSDAAPSRTFLEQRIAELQEHFPLLYVRIEGHRTTNPVEVLREKPWPAEDILDEAEYQPEDDDSVEIGNILQKNGQKKSTDDLNSRPLWQVTIDTSLKKSTTYITLVADHLIVDGKGLSIFFDALLAKDVSQLPYEKLETIPRLEDTMNIKPSLSFLLPMVWQHLILPRLPFFIQRFFSTGATWPATHVRESPFNCSPGYSLLSIPADQMASLKQVARAHNILALHAVLKSIYALAIWSKFRHTLSPFRLTASTPRSERDYKLGHAYCMGNYVSSYQFDIQFTPGESFWVVAKKVFDYLMDPESIESARMRMGILEQVPDGVYDPPHADPHRPTKWEDFFLNEAASEKPFGEALSFSNLGHVKLPENAKDVAWVQIGGSLASAGFSTAVLGHEKGLRLNTIYLEGAAVTKEDVKDIERLFVVILKRLIEGKDNVDELLVKV